MIKITDIYSKLNEENSEKGDVKVADLIKDDSKSGAAKAAILKKKWQISSHDIAEVAEFKKKKLAAELSKLNGDTNEAKVNEEEKDEYEEFFNMKLKKWSVKSPNELSAEDKKKFFAEIEEEWDKENESIQEALSASDKEIAKDLATKASNISDINKLKAFLKASDSDSDDIKNFKKSRLRKELMERKGHATSKTKDDKTDEAANGLDEKKACKKKDKKKEEDLDTEDFDKKKEVNESEQIDIYTSKYYHFYEKMFSKVDTKEKIDEIVTSVFPKLAEDVTLTEARGALLFFRNFRLAELGIE